MIFNYRVSPTAEKNSPMETIERMVTISHVGIPTLIEFAREMENKLVVSTGTSSDITLGKKESIVLSVVTNAGLETYLLDEFVDNQTGVIKNIERFLIDANARIHITYKRRRRHKFAIVTHSYLIDALGVIKVTDENKYSVFDIPTGKINSISDTILNLRILRFNYIPEFHNTPSVRVDYITPSQHNVFKETKYFSSLYAEHVRYFNLSRLLAGFKISADLKKLHIKLAIDPRFRYTIDNPWLLDELGISKKFDTAEFTAKLEYLTEIHKLKHSLPMSGFSKAKLTMEQIKLFGLGRFFNYHIESSATDDIRKINLLYEKYGIHTVMKEHMCTTRQARSHSSGNYVEFNFK